MFFSLQFYCSVRSNGEQKQNEKKNTKTELADWLFRQSMVEILFNSQDALEIDTNIDVSTKSICMNAFLFLQQNEK